jgi:aminoglycoside phosphotransferase (APT) family kinase protein
VNVFPDVDKTALAVARKLGIPCDRPVVLAEGMNAVVHLRPSPLVARVTRVAHLVRPVEALGGVVTMARALRGLVVSPSDQVDPGPHVEDGRYVTFWAHVEGVPATPTEAGSSLRALHQAARRYDLRLRSFDPRPEALRIANLVGGEVGAILRIAAERMNRPGLTEQPVHGDAHLGNVLAGGLWLDLDEACTGPPEWDLACLRHCFFLFGELERETREALAAYGSYDEAAVAALDPLVVLFTAAWGSLAPLIGEPIGSRTLRRLAWLRERYVL